MKVTLNLHSRYKGRLAGKIRDAIATVAPQVVERAVAILSDVAEAKLSRNARTYQKALLEAVSVTTAGLKIKLTGFAKDLENGFPARDLKPELLASDNVKQGKEGRYIDVPFRHALEANATRFQGMPPEIKARVQATVRSERNAARAQGREERNPLRVTPKLPAANEKHTTSIHSQMLRMVNQSGKQATSKYQTIRRVSENSDAQAWRHPGFEGIHALWWAKVKLTKMFETLVLRELKRIFK